MLSFIASNVSPQRLSRTEAYSWFSDFLISIKKKGGDICAAIWLNKHDMAAEEKHCPGADIKPLQLQSWEGLWSISEPAAAETAFG